MMSRQEVYTAYVDYRSDEGTGAHLAMAAER